MKRNLKFRIWDKQSKRFVQNDAGTHCISNWHIDAFTGEVVDFTASIGKFGFSKSKSPSYYVDGTKVVKECPYVVEQFTGLLDKNGKEIFEGDIVRIFNNRRMLTNGQKDENAIHLVEWENLGFKFSLKNGRYAEGCGYISIHPIEYEIIGNILKNPDLLK